MMTFNTRLIGLYVDRFSKQWVVRDPEGNFWIVPSVDNGWEHRQPFHLTEESELDVIPKHYIHLLDLPFLGTER
jgi:hypothetical protein